MRPATLYGLLALPALAFGKGLRGIRIVQSNDDGWAELSARQLLNALTAASYNVVLSAPADNESGKGSKDASPTVRTEPCQYNSCAAGSATGSNATDPRLNWVNSYPATAMQVGIDTFAPKVWNGRRPQLAVTGPNVGGNRGLQMVTSGTVGAAARAVNGYKIPAIAFSGSDSTRNAWNARPAAAGKVYAELATYLVGQVIASGTPYLPDGVLLNVNFPEVSTNCQKLTDFKWTLSRVYPGIFSAKDTEYCGSQRLPTEYYIGDLYDCYISVSVVQTSDKTTASASDQAVVLKKLAHIFTCPN